MSPIPIIDLFAGPGGLNEGFSRLGEAEGSPIFETVGSFEMESSAIKTLTLRGVYRHLFRSGEGVPESYYRYITGELSHAEFNQERRIADAFEAASGHVHQVELGGDDDKSHDLIRVALNAAGVSGTDAPWVLIGGPPCQAYSLAGRSRRANDETFARDKKHFLYREYLNIIREFAPPVFVMENVKGLLSSTNEGRGMFKLIKDDLESPAGPNGGLHYEIHSVVEDKTPDDLLPRDFIIKSEEYGVPQKRHRVILLGIRKDLTMDSLGVGKLAPAAALVTVGDALKGMPALRSTISPSRLDSEEGWSRVRSEVVDKYDGLLAPNAPTNRGSRSEPRLGKPSGEFGAWTIDDGFDRVIQHESRGHMIEDLKRYWFAATEGHRGGVSPRLSSFPPELQPKHKNAAAPNRPFADRFRVQVRDKPSTTIVSHISKDGHYYIHPDPDQMRSLTVREAARLQTFPDNYFFEGNRTQQYHQVGNAVPPLLAYQIARVVANFLDAITPS